MIFKQNFFSDFISFCGHVVQFPMFFVQIFEIDLWTGGGLSHHCEFVGNNNPYWTPGGSRLDPWVDFHAACAYCDLSSYFMNIVELYRIYYIVKE